jgi:membrane associated rhomboid family serine protease
VDNWLNAIYLIAWLTGIIWGLALFNHLQGYEFNRFGIYPRDLQGLAGVFSWVVLHADLTHLLINTTPLLFMGFFVALRGPVLFIKITLTIWIMAGLAVWVFGRPAIHIGASGLVFGYFGFILAVAIYERSLFDLGVATLTMFYYGGMFFGILPVEAFVSWESHLFGLLSGVFAARVFGKDWVSTRIV